MTESITAAASCPEPALSSYLKRAFDVAVAVSGLFLTAWLILITWAVMSVLLRRDALILTERTGRWGAPFLAVTLRLSNDDPAEELPDEQLMLVARWVRRAKLHRLPALINLLMGELSVVGPESEVLAYANTLEGDSREVLALRPGITGAGARLVGGSLAEKLVRERQYLARRSFLQDLYLLF